MPLHKRAGGLDGAGSSPGASRRPGRSTFLALTIANVPKGSRLLW